MFDAEDLLFLGSELALVGLRVFYGEFLLICTAYQYSYLQKKLLSTYYNCISLQNQI
jgi:hypothetical protein